MTKTQFDVLGIGNAIVDILAHVDDEFLIRHEIEKDAMTLVDAERSDSLYDAMPPAVEISGGSVANSSVGVASFGGATAYIGKVRDDQLGKVFSHDIRAAGVHYQTPSAVNGPATARCMIVVTPDAHRSMNTYLGAATQLDTDDIDEQLVQSAAITYLEGYLYDPPGAKQAFHKASKIAADAGRKVSLTLSDSFCVDRYRSEFRDLVDNHVDILFANEAELISLFETDTVDAAIQAVRGRCEVAAVTRSAAGSVVVAGGEIHIVDAVPVENLVDTTGAGDLYAAGFLFGYARGLDHVRCGQLGSLAAAEIISHFGARPEVSLADLARQHDLI